MKIIAGDKGHIDFDEPIQMSEEQKNAFLILLRTVFDPTIVLEEKTNNLREKRLGELKVFGNKWDPVEYELLLDYDKSNEELSAKLGRSWMAVNIKRGLFISEFHAWQEQNNKSENPENRIQLIKEFLESKRVPNRIQEIINSIKEIKDWFYFIKEKEDNKIVFEKLIPQPAEEDFKKAIKEIRKSEEFKRKYHEYYND